MTKLRSKYKGVYVRGNIVWITFRYKGQRCRESTELIDTPANQKFAFQKLQAIKFEKAKNTFNYADFFPNSKNIFKFGGKLRTNLTITEAMSDWFDRFKMKKKSVKTIKNYRYDIDTHIIPHIGNILLQDVCAKQLDEWLLSLSCSERNKQNILIPLKSMLKESIKYGYISSNPMDDVDIPIAKKKQPNPLTHDEIDAFLSVLNGQELNFYEVAIWTGLSTGEQMTLYWDDINFADCTLRVERAYDEESPDKIGATKNEYRERTVELLEPAWNALQRQYEISGHGRIVFPNQRTNKITRYETLSKVWKKALNEIGVAYRAPYQTRHTFASTMLSAGLPLGWIKQQMGHTSLEMLDKSYGKWMKKANTVRDWVKRKTQNGHNGKEFESFLFK